MYFEKHLDVIDACRFCFMCRHLDPVGNVTFREADTPRGRALVCDRIRMDDSNLSNPDFIDTMYRSALSGACRQHCVSGYDEAGLVLAMRKDVVAADLAPAPVKALAERLEKAAFEVMGKGGVIYFGAMPELYDGCAILRGGDPGKALAVLGFEAASEEVFERFRKALPADVEKLVVAEPSAYDFLRDKLPDIEVVTSAEYLLAQGVAKGSARKAVYIESDFLKNYRGNPSAPRDLLAQAGCALVPFGTNVEESFAVGEGAVVMDDLYPNLVRQLCARVYGLARKVEDACFVTASGNVRDTLKKYNPDFDVVTLEEAVSQK